MDTLEICYMSAGDLSKLVQKKEVSPVEIIDAHLSRIEATEPVLNSFITLLADESRAAARQADEAALETLAKQNPIRITSPEGDRVEIAGHNLGACLRTAEVTSQVSLVSQASGVRRALVAQQRALAGSGRIVMVGRDIGTVVLPGSELKIYLTASAQNRARRRWQELLDRGQDREFNLVLKETEERDRLDSQREDSPLKPAEDSWVVDTSDLDADQVVELILARAGIMGGATRK